MKREPLVEVELLLRALSSRNAALQAIADREGRSELSPECRMHDMADMARSALRAEINQPTEETHA